MVSTWDIVRERPNLQFIALQRAIENCDLNSFQAALRLTNPNVLTEKKEDQPTLIELAVLLNCPLGKKKDKRTIIEDLVKSNPDVVNLPGMEGRTPLHWAVLQNDTGLVDYFITKKANVTAVDDKGQTPLFYAHVDPYKAGVAQKIVNALLDKVNKVNNVPAFINAQDYDGNTALHVWAQQRDANAHLPLVNLLLQAEGIDISIENNQNKTALDIARGNPSATGIQEALEFKQQQVSTQKK